MWSKIVNKIGPELVEKKLSNVAPETLLDMLIKAQGKLEQAYIEPESRSKNKT